MHRRNRSSLMWMLLPLTAVVGVFTAHAEDDLKAAHDACPKVFGSAKQRADNKTQREADVIDLSTSRSRVQMLVTVPHWTSPKSSRVPGMRLEKRGPRVVVTVDDSMEKVCPQGSYTLELDANIGRGMRVLAEVPEGLLVERQTATGSHLMTLPFDNVAAPTPTYQVMWRSSFQLVAQVDSSSSSSAGTPSAVIGKSSMGSSTTDDPKDPVARAKARSQRAKERRERRKKERERRRNEASKLVNDLPTTRLSRDMEK